MAKPFDAEAIEEILGVGFHNHDLLLQAFTARSFGDPHNGILGFHGDKIWGMIITRMTIVDAKSNNILQGTIGDSYNSVFWHLDTAIAANIVAELGLAPYLRTGSGQHALTPLKENSRLCRAIIGALSIDQSITVATMLVKHTFLPIAEQSLVAVMADKELSRRPSSIEKQRIEFRVRLKTKKEELANLLNSAELTATNLFLFYSQEHGYHIATVVGGRVIGLGIALTVEEAHLRSITRAHQLCKTIGVERLKETVAAGKGSEAHPIELLLQQSSHFARLDPHRQQNILRDLIDGELHLEDILDKKNPF